MRQLLRLSLLFACLSVCSFAQAQNPDPRDYEIGYFVPSKTTIANVYLRNASAVEGRNFSSNQAAFRATYILKWGDLVLTPFDLILPVADVTAYVPIQSLSAAVGSEVNVAARASGFGDLIFLPTIGYGFTQNAANHTHTYFALTTYITAPTGKYERNGLVNVGNNRWAINPLLMVGQRFLRAVTLEAMANVAFYTDNDEFRVPTNPMLRGRDLTLEQKPSFGAALHLGIDLSPTFLVGTSYLLNVNGERTFDLPTGMQQQAADTQTVHAIRLNLGIRVTPTTLLLAQWNQEVAGDNGAAVGRFFGLRITHVIPGAQPPAPRPVLTDQPGTGVNR
jgi:hypothetical protein